MPASEAKIIRFKTNGSPEEGYLCAAQSESEIPFEIKRVFWTFFTPDSITRGTHAHYKTEMILIAVSGSVEIITESFDGRRNRFRLTNPEEGLFIPCLTWHEMTYSHDAVQLVITSSLYDENDYIRDYDAFKALKNEL